MLLQLSGGSLCLSKESSCFPESLGVQIFIIQRVKARAIACPHQLPTRGDNTVSVAQVAFATGQCIKRIIYIYIYIYARSIKSRDYIGRPSSLLVYCITPS